MKKTEISGFDLDMYEETLDNGLQVYILPKKNVNNIYATFSTKYGSKINEFVPIGEKEMVCLPNGIAHFLEHKLFEQKDKIDPFTFYSERGADCNANTSKVKTTYLFSGTENFDENINFLLDYVQEPYFTDENVNKEKGIIEQEIKMYDDQPFWVMMDGITYNTFHKDPIRIPIAGTVKSINKITKEDLYKCYNTFYAPSNMFVVITGNVDPIKTLDLIRENQAKKDYKKHAKIKCKNYDEPKEVFKNYEEKHMDVVIPKFSINYKIDVTGIKLEDYMKLEDYLYIFTSCKFGCTSLFAEKLKLDGLISFDLDIDFYRANNYVILSFVGESKEPKKVLELIKQEMQDFYVSEEDLNRKKKMMKASMFYASDNIFSMNNKIMSSIIRYGYPFTDFFKKLNSINIKDYKKYISKLDFTNFTEYLILSNK